VLDGGSSTTDRDRKLRWEKLRSTQLETFVSEVSQTLLVLHELHTADDRRAFLAFLSAEIDNHEPVYSASQLTLLRKTRDDLVGHGDSDLLTTTPVWFLPWYELVTDLTSSIGEGGFGCVYRAKWLDSEVVVKQVLRLGSTTAAESWSIATSYLSSARSIVGKVPAIPATATEDSNDKTERKKAQEMFEHEVSVWFGLSHPHIVRLFGACHVGTPFFVCEYASNGSLDKYLRQHPYEIWQKLHEAALGVQYLHSRDIVHGDLKCNNIVIGSDGKAKVTDFGLSSSDQLTGAWHWVAPECLENGASRLSVASDVYSLGMCVVEALRVVEVTVLKLDERKHPPFPWGNLENNVVKVYVVRKRELPKRPQTSSDVQWDVVERMCTNDPAHRIKISTVVSELAKLAKLAGVSDGASKVAPSEPEDVPELIPEVIARMKSCCERSQESQDDQSFADRELLRQTHDLLYDRLKHLISVIARTNGELEVLRPLLEKVQKSTVGELSSSLIQFTELALRGYALHRELDKLIDANFWEIDGEGGQVHDWKSRFNTLLGMSDTGQR
jgi:serine/threonine protein kinase